ncbi:MAG: hypothetical protein HY013_15900, partial [Candidatus Solibacter usitatus]|nr:hypothetical protein [Candidatus Solibacter usitatus]
ASATRIEVDNVRGSIHVAGDDAREIRMTVTETVHAESKEDLERARREVKLDITEKEGTLRLCADGPFRCPCDQHDWPERRYWVQYDFQLRVPRSTFLALRTVNHGDIKVETTDGDYDLRNINGGIEMIEVSGSGRAYSLNRPLQAMFRRNPQRDSSYGSLNGKVYLHFQPGLAADFRMKTFNGKVYSDFPMTALPAKPASLERRDGKTVYRADRFTGGRIGAGGIEIKLDGFNGDMHIWNRSEHE